MVNPSSNPDRDPAPMAGLWETVTSLSENLCQSEPLLRYRAVEQKLKADTHASRLLADLSELQQKMRAQQAIGPNPKDDVARLRALQAEINNNEIIQDTFLARELVVDLLRDVNQEISNLLGVDFASLARRSSGCC